MSVAETVLRLPLPRTDVGKISQIVVRRLFDTDNVYVFQNSDRRLIFASPYQRDFTLIGTIATPFRGDPAAVSMAADEVAYLCDAANRYFREHIDPSDVIRTVSGANTMIGTTGHGGGDVRCKAWQGAAADGVWRRSHDRAASRGVGGLPADAILSDVAALDRYCAAARRRFRVDAV